jgi:hypothetical protein
MKTHRPFLRTAPRRFGRFGSPLCWVVGLLLGACAAPEAPSAKTAAADAPGLAQQIRHEIGDAACSATAQCRTLAVGHKACGGPEAYLVWSTAASNEARLRALATDHAAARKAEDAKSGRVSNCAMVADPGARCDAGHCVPAGRGPAIMGE